MGRVRVPRPAWGLTQRPSQDAAVAALFAQADAEELGAQAEAQHVMKQARRAGWHARGVPSRR